MSFINPQTAPTASTAKIAVLIQYCWSFTSSVVLGIYFVCFNRIELTTTLIPQQALHAIANVLASRVVSGRRICQSVFTGLNIIAKTVLKNAAKYPIDPVSSQGMPVPGAIRSNT